jgi:hypothetical protein
LPVLNQRSADEIASYDENGFRINDAGLSRSLSTRYFQQT